LADNIKNGRRLIGWKAIGQFLACTARTARRWEASRAMPVHRIPGGARGSVWANPDELRAWLEALPGDVQAALRAEAESVGGESVVPLEPAPLAVSVANAPISAAERARAARRRGLGWAAALVFTTLTVGAATAWMFAPHGSGADAQDARTPYDDNREARETYMTARFELANRTAESLSAAEKGFQQLVDHYPDRAAGWSGLADSYLLLREFGSLTDADAYPRAARAAHTAVALDPGLADAWLDQAFVAWWWQGDSATAFHAFQTAQQLDPASAKAFHWYATALYAHGDRDQALQAIARARALDPASRAIVADEAWLRFACGQRAEGLATLERLAQIDPRFVAWHRYLAHAYLILGRDTDFLREALAAAQLRGQLDVAAQLNVAGERLRSGGRQALLEQLTVNEGEEWARGSGSAVVAAQYRALAGDASGMYQWLAVAEAHHDHQLPGARAYPEFAAFRDQPAFQDLVRRLP
jgi:tetratricopeptide (TPR) repeat protein